MREGEGREVRQHWRGERGKGLRRWGNIGGEGGGREGGGAKEGSRRARKTKLAGIPIGGCCHCEVSVDVQVIRCAQMTCTSLWSLPRKVL